MNKIVLNLEYKAFPVWLYNEEGKLLDNDSPEDLRSNEEIDILLVNLQADYNKLFIDNATEFKYIGFDNEEEKQNFINRSRAIYQLIVSDVGDHYNVVNNISL